MRPTYASTDNLSEISESGTGRTGSTSGRSGYSENRDELLSILGLAEDDEIFTDRFRIDRKKLEDMIMCKWTKLFVVWIRINCSRGVKTVRFPVRNGFSRTPKFWSHHMMAHLSSLPYSCKYLLTKKQKSQKKMTVRRKIKKMFQIISNVDALDVPNNSVFFPAVNHREFSHLEMENLCISRDA